MQADLRNLLLADSALSALLGADSDGTKSINWITRPDSGGIPAITLNSDEIPIYTQDGRNGLRQARVQFDCWGESYGAALLACNRLTIFLESLRGVTQGATIFVCAYLDTARDFDAEDIDGGQRIYRRSADFIISHYGSA